MPPNLQMPNYGYVALAGQQIGQGLQQLPGAMKADASAKQLKLDINSAEKIRQDRIVEAAGEYLEATGKSGADAEREAYAAAARRYTPVVGAEREKPEVALSRWDKADNEWYKSLLPDLKKKRYFQETGSTRTSVKYDRPEGTVQAGEPVVPEQPTIPPIPTTPEQVTENRAADTRRLSAMPSTISEMQGGALAEPRVVTDVTIPPDMTPEERYQRAQELGVYTAPEVQADIGYASQAALAGQEVPQGAVRSDVARTAMEQPAYTGAMKDYVGSYPTEKDIMTDERLKASAAQRADYQRQRLKIDGLKAALQSRKLTQDERRDILNDKAKNDVAKLRLETQIQALKAGVTKANKDVMGRLDQSGLESTYQELEDLQSQLYIIQDNSKDFDDLLSEKGGINPPLSPQGEPKPQGPSRKGFTEWLNQRK